MPVGTTRARELPDEVCFNLWIELGSTAKAADHLAYEMDIKAESGYPYHYTSIQQSVYRYILENMDKAREVMKGRGAGFAERDESWYDWTVRKAWTRWCNTPIRFIEWMYENDLDIDRYSYIYKKRMDMVRDYQRRYLERLGMVEDS